MKKSLIAAAVVSALPAFAQAQTNVTMYGIADMSINMVDRGDLSRSAVTIDSGNQSASRWGVRGSEDLGGGLKAMFQFEAGVRVDTGGSDAAGFFQRIAQVGLQGNFGTIKLGRGYTPAFRTVGTYDALSYGLFGNMLSATAGADQAQTRFSNAIMYDSPSWGGFQILAAYTNAHSGDELDAPSPYLSTVDRDVRQGLDIALQYKGGPLNVGGYFQQTNTDDGAGNALSKDRMGIGAGYQFGSFRLVGGYSQTSQEIVGGADYEVEAYHIGGIMKLGTGSLHIQYIGLQQDAADADGSVLGVAYSHPLSKRTNLYAHIGLADNDSNGRLASLVMPGGSNYSPDGLGSNVKGFGVGIRHVF